VFAGVCKSYINAQQLLNYGRMQMNYVINWANRNSFVKKANSRIRQQV
jgi:hypothetical protein